MTSDFRQQAAAKVEGLGDDLDLETFAAAFNLFRVSTKLIQDLDTNVHRKLGLSIAGFRVMFTVWVFDTLEPREIARLSGVTRAAISGVLNTLERGSLIRRTREQTDKRLISVRLTAKGEELIQTAYRAQNKREQLQFASLTRAEIQAFSAIMAKLIDAKLPGQS